MHDPDYFTHDAQVRADMDDWQQHLARSHWPCLLRAALSVVQTATLLMFLAAVA